MWVPFYRVLSPSLTPARQPSSPLPSLMLYSSCFIHHKPSWLSKWIVSVTCSHLRDILPLQFLPPSTQDFAKRFIIPLLGRFANVVSLANAVMFLFSYRNDPNQVVKILLEHFSSSFLRSYNNPQHD